MSTFNKPTGYKQDKFIGPNLPVWYVWKRGNGKVRISKGEDVQRVRTGFSYLRKQKSLLGIFEDKASAIEYANSL